MREWPLEEPITGDLNNFTLTGAGLTGGATVDPTAPPGSSAEALLATVHPDRSRSFIAYDVCNCRFRGQAGQVMIRFYGTTSENGVTYGTFLVVSGGAANGGLATLAGWGTFSSAGQLAGTWRLVEHLVIT